MDLLFSVPLSDEIEKHIQRVSESCFICAFCGYQCHNLANMINHVKSRHFRRKDYPCSLCDMAFTTPPYRQKHYKQKHGLYMTAKEIAKMVEKSTY